MSPHMTGRSEPDASGETRSASELLDDDGKVDTSKIHELTNAGGAPVDKVDAEEVTEMRQRLILGKTTGEVSKEMDRSAEIVRLHAKGEAKTTYDSEPDCPPVEYRGGDGWVVTDD